MFSVIVALIFGTNMHGKVMHKDPPNLIMINWLHILTPHQIIIMLCEGLGAAIKTSYA